ncbi:MAG: DUF3999 family protein [Bryobacterales bacterium]|nr:DUF3999 family protein [Bryobacterales bacterium]
MKSLILSVVLVGAAAAQDFDASLWRFRQPFRVNTSERVPVLPLDPNVYGRARTDFADLRVVRDGIEIPYVLERFDGSVAERTLSAKLIDRTITPEGALRVTLDLGEGPHRHGRVRISTAEKNFRRRVRVETSEDNTYWATAREEAYLFDFSQDGREISVLTVDYPESTRRYIRLAIGDWSRPDTLTGATAFLREEKPAEREVLSSVLPEVSQEGRTTVLSLDLAREGIPYDRITFDTGEAPFHRAVELEFSMDRKDWRVYSRGVIWKHAAGSSLSLSFPERHERYLRARIFNGNDAPVSVFRVHIEGPRRVLKLAPGIAGDYILYFGNPKAERAEYDLRHILARQGTPGEEPAIAERWQPNPLYRGATLPWTDRYPAVLYTILGLAILIMVAITVRFLRKVRL